MNNKEQNFWILLETNCFDGAEYYTFQGFFSNPSIGMNAADSIVAARQNFWKTNWGEVQDIKCPITSHDPRNANQIEIQGYRAEANGNIIFEIFPFGINVLFSNTYFNTLIPFGWIQHIMSNDKAE